MKKLVILSLSTVAAISLIGCGGGGGGDTSSSSVTPSSTSTVPTTIEGTVADGYLVGAKVCLDKNLNSICDSGEPSDITVAGGKYTLLNITGVELSKYPIVAEVLPTTIDEDTNTTVGGEGYVLEGLPGNTFVSPLTTQVRQYMLTNDTNETAAKEHISTQLGIDEKWITTDYVASSDTDAVKAHETAKVIARVTNSIRQAIDTEDSNYTEAEVNSFVTSKITAALPSIKTDVEAASNDADTIAFTIFSNVNTATYSDEIKTTAVALQKSVSEELAMKTDLIELTNSTTIKQNQKYRITTRLGIDKMVRFHVENSFTNICYLHELPTTLVNNDYPDTILHKICRLMVSQVSR